MCHIQYPIRYLQWLPNCLECGDTGYLITPSVNPYDGWDEILCKCMDGK